jgi:formamidopyrimidine-DNA glycosylase
VPELPEVESYRQLAEGALGRTIAKVDTPDAWYLKHGTTGTALRRALVGRRLVGTRRIGKLLLLEVDTGAVVGLRFGMTGTLLLDGVAGTDDLQYAPHRRERSWERFRVRFEDGGVLAMHDPRRLGGVVLDPTLDHLGPDALVISRAELAAALATSSAPLKARLLDQSVVAGVGNLIADELLWRAGLSPLRTSRSLTPAEVRRLHRHLVGVLADLGERGGSHLGDLMEERHPAGRCPKDGAELSRATVGGRTSWWCPDHQT